MNNRHERFSGNILLYDYLSRKRAPIFLNRNLTRALSVHRHLLGKANAQDSFKEIFDLRPAWKPPTWDALDEMVDLDSSKGCFILQIHSIKPEEQTQRNELPEPTAQRRLLLRENCTIHISVFAPLSEELCADMITQTATLQGISRAGNKSVFVDTKRVVIDPNKFKFPHVQTETNNAFKMMISINLESQIHAGELYKHLGPTLASSQDPSTRLTAKWSNILEVPKSKRILPLQAHKESLGFGLEVTMTWNSIAGDSVLATYNKHLRALERPEINRVSQVHPMPSRPRIKLIFVYAKERITRFGLVCPHEECEKRFTSIDDLRMHFDMTKDYFKYEAAKQGLDEEGNEVWMFTSEVSDHRANRADQRASARADEPFDVRIIKPQQLFDEHRYLNMGDDSYHRAARNHTSYTASRAPVMVPISVPAPLRRKPPDEVQDLPVQRKKQYPVPQAPPGVTFFRSVSRRPLQTGEYISESDDEVDDTWIQLRKSAEFKKDRSLTEPTKRFLEGFDAHMWHERLQSDVHVGDALIRFVRRNCNWVWQEKVYEPFKKKIDELLQDSIISQETHASSLSLVEAARLGLGEDVGAGNISQRLAALEVRQSSHDDLYEDALRLPARPNKGKGKAMITDTGHLTPITADSDGDFEMRDAALSSELVRTEQQKDAVNIPYDLCLCGADAQASSRNSPLVACSFIDCIRRNFHYDCIRQRWNIAQDVRTLRKSAWVCEDCKPHTSTGN